eukprot:symbB.v1.2.018515.t1/scaffold1480.1/size116223/3
MAAPAVAPKPRWADIVDSSQEDNDTIGPLPSPPVRSDSWQDSQLSQQNSQSSVCELLQNTELSSQPEPMTSDAAGSSDLAASMVNTAGYVPEARAPLSSRLTAAAMRSSPQVKEKKRAPNGAQPSPVAKKRYRRTRKAPAREDDETSASKDRARTQEEINKRRGKRRRVVEGQKKKANYQAFNAARPRAERHADEPMTPDPESDLSKRPWESQVQKWRKGLRDWFAENVGVADDDGDEDEISESEGE